MTHQGDVPPDSAGRRRITSARRQWAVEALCEAYARDQLMTQELERRLDEAHRARTEGELAALLSDLSLEGWRATGTAVAPSEASAGGLHPAPTRERPGRVSRAAPDQVPTRQLSVAIFSGRTRRGSWIPASRITAIAMMGGVELDFREAVFGPGTTHVHVYAVMGGVEIIVPPDLPVEASGFAIMGGFEDRSELHTPPDPGGPLLKVSGFATMGGVEVDVRLPGESAGQARRRRRRERRKKR